MRLLIFGHWSHTGFGIVTRALAERFLRAGIDVRVLAVNHRGEPVRGPLSGRVWPANMFGDGFGGNISSSAIDGSLWRKLDPLDDWRADGVLVVSDMSGFTGHIGPRITPQWLSVPVWHYCPIEGDNLPVSWRDIWNQPGQPLNLPGQFYPVAMSEYGRRQIAAHLGRDVPMIYHGVDTETFHPVSVANPVTHEGKVCRTKEQARAAFGIPTDAKVIFRFDRLVERKFYHLFLAAMAPVLAADPDAMVLIHCAPVDGNLNLYEEIGRLPVEVWPQVKLTQAHDTWTGLPVESLVALINCADLVVSTTSGEGFGLTLAESLACGVPVVVTDWAAEREVVGPGGLTIPPLHDAYGTPVRYHSTYGMDWCVPDARAFTHPVQELLAKPHRRKAMGDAGRAHVKRSFDWDVAAAQFLDLFTVPAEAAA